MKVQFHASVSSEGERVITIIHEGKIQHVPKDHPNFVRILDALMTDQDPFPFFNITAAIAGIDTRLKVHDDTVIFEGKPVHAEVVGAIERYRLEGRDMTGIVKFLERLEKNPSEHARQQLFDWVRTSGLIINADGMFIGWKGVRDDGTSVTAGSASIDGVRITGNIPNRVGTTITMPREEVDARGENACSFGLHVGSKKYAGNFGPLLLEALIDPADVVSVPHSGVDKLRCCRYKVLAVHDPRKDAHRHEPAATWSSDEAEKRLAIHIPAEFLRKVLDKLKTKEQS